MSKYIKSVDIDKLQQAAIFVTENGTIEKINSRFTALLGWKSAELVKQNVSLLVSPKLMKKSTHDALLKSYKLNKESRIIGKPRLLPTKNVDDEEVFLSVQIIPVGTPKNYCFLVFFSPPHERMSYISDEEMVEVLSAHFKKLPKDEDFSSPAKGTATELISIVKTYLEEEISIISKFLTDNYPIEEAWKLSKYLLFKRKQGKLGPLYEMIVKNTEKPRLLYTNIIWFRILLPIFTGPNASAELRTKALAFGQQLKLDSEKSHTSSGSFSD
eukprot:TRINITY_DN1804_c0_g1_i1.p1 TRINITY_DN1804_c0_g1~~TRINITY_DN1804_c0_g1_i1.p1  ORF type:complete len:302 (+),score=69.80 TRINITY_DN1804_c0_g1_i1:95-907(+)